MTMKSFHRQAILIFTFITSLSFGQEYQESYQDYADGYQQDNLYADYAMKQQDKAAGGGNGPGLGRVLLFGGAGWVGGAVYKTRQVKKTLQKKQMVEAKKLYSQYYNDVYKLQEQNVELAGVIDKLQEALQKAQEKRETEAMQRDYDEFKQPDVDGDDKISRAEFNMYIKNYLTNYPGLTEKDYPKFDDFDHDNDGYINFSEYSKQMKLQAKKAEQDAIKAHNSGSAAAAKKAGTKAAAYHGLSSQNKRADSFDDLYAQYF